MKTSMNSVAIAATIAKDIELLRDCDMIAAIYRNVLPESYVPIENLIVSNYRVSIYDMNLIGKKSYLLSIKHLGDFQVM